MDKQNRYKNKYMSDWGANNNTSLLNTYFITTNRYNLNCLKIHNQFIHIYTQLTS